MVSSRGDLLLSLKNAFAKRSQLGNLSSEHFEAVPKNSGRGIRSTAEIARLGRVGPF
ncbi:MULTISPECIES: hypothetical protein [unclassified Bradyrhizobium]|uniref:hypothetical protein n=1 Tax=Bradyrhizobium TaxID=374 RepID=UPI0004ADEB9C|nr:MULTISPECIES: hypothetical protein [unclassified Bradyrhizobium]